MQAATTIGSGNKPALTGFTPWLVCLAVFALLPLTLGPYWLNSAIMGLFYVMMASSWNLLAGYTGQVSFAHAAFAGIGCYTSGILSAKLGLHPLLGLPLGVAMAALLSLALGALCIRMGGIYLSLTTLGFSEIVRIVIQNEYEITRGTMGLKVPFIIGPYSKITAFYLMLAVAVAMVGLIAWLVNSDMGLKFRAVLNDETAARSLGVNVTRARVFAFVISGAMAGLAGSIYGHYLLLITPHIPSLDLMFHVLAMAVIGGLGTLAGPVVGALLLEVLSEFVRHFSDKYHILVFGCVALLFARFAPQGLVGLVGDWWKKAGAKGGE
ncbi:branched-chain amino acid ABC transporter permease [Dethiosulfatarculus sandiegensis]|uniref:ABC transporter permease n=1 Tax=Dethiosulfatarculus sandiegensis TaxID=1429043 RepID=A0A0D2GLK3_9BACT|nr:branched-chain amino acid ABC transporter permease [Dethiosulfatarculus sandiegensis]KIX15522.1 ABC transporter permease [Dethiosulfatarculus sandiegensis]